MGNLFGIRRRAPIITAQDRAILQLKQQRDKIKIYQKKTEADLIKTKELALQLFQKGWTDRALVVLRRKKCMAEILSRTDKQLETLEQCVSDIEYAQIEVSVVEGLKTGTEALKQLNSLMNIDDIQQMMEDNQEAAEKQREISELLQGTAVRYDEDELLQELEALKTDKQPSPVKQATSDKQKPPSPVKHTTPTKPQQVIDLEPEVPADEVESLPAESAEEANPAEQDRRIEDLPAVPDNLPEVPEGDLLGGFETTEPEAELKPKAATRQRQLEHAD